MPHQQQKTRCDFLNPIEVVLASLAQLHWSNTAHRSRRTRTWHTHARSHAYEMPMIKNWMAILRHAVATFDSRAATSPASRLTTQDAAARLRTLTASYYDHLRDQRPAATSPTQLACDYAALGSAANFSSSRDQQLMKGASAKSVEGLRTCTHGRARARAPRCASPRALLRVRQHQHGQKERSAEAPCALMINRECH